MRDGLKLLTIAVLLLAGAAAWPATIPIEGRVVGSTDQPLAEAEVTLAASLGPVERAIWVLANGRPEPISRSRTDAAGRFRIEAPHAGHWIVRVEAPGHVPVEMQLLGLLEPPDLPNAELVPDTGLTVRLVSPEAAPLEGGLVRLVVSTERRGFEQLEWTAAARSGFSGPDGAVRLPRGEGEPTIITASAPGRELVEQKFTRGTSVTVKLPSAKLQTIEVRSALGGTVTDVLVSVGDQLHPAGFTDDAGRAQVAEPGRGDLPLRLDVEDGRGLQTRISRGQQSDEPRVLTLPDRRSVSGTVIDAETRRPVAGSLVWDQARVWAGAVTNETGAFTLHGPLDHRMFITACAPRYLVSHPTEFALDDSGRRGPVLALDPAAAIEGLVVDASGNPVPDAEVALETKRTGGMMRIEIDFGGGGPPTTRTTERGRFRLSPVNPEKDYEMRVHAEGFGPAAKDIKGLRPYETQSGHRIELRAGQTVTGTVVDPEGIALADARVTLRPAPKRADAMVMRMGGGADPPTFNGTTGAEGRFEVSGLAPGPVDLEIRRSGYAKRVAQGLEVAESDSPTDLGEFNLEPGERLQGRVIDPDGGAIEGAGVRLVESRGGMWMVGPGGGDREPDAVTGPDGWFTLEDLAAGEPVDIQANRTGFVAATRKAVPVPTEELLDIKLEPASRVSGTVQDEDGVGIPGAQVSLSRTLRREMGGQAMMMMSMEREQSDSEGRFEFEDVQPGEISLSAQAAGWQEGKLDAIEVPKGKDVENIALTLDAGAFVEGRVMAPDGRAAVGATVRKVEASQGMIPNMGGAFTDGAGYYRLEGLAPGQVSVEATHDDYPRVVRDIEVETGINALDLQFEGGQRVSGTVIDESGTPVPSAWVGLNPAGRGWGGPDGKTDASGSFVIDGVRDGDYSLSATAEGYAPNNDGADVSVEGEPVHGLQVVLDRGGTIVGTVRGVQPEDFPRIEIHAQRTEGMGWKNAAVDHEGRYEIYDLAAGEWKLTANLADTGRQATGRTEVQPGDTETVLDLEFGLGLVLSGNVVEGREPVIGASVFAAGTDIERSGWASTDAEGGFRVEGLESGTYSVEVRNWSTGLSYDETIELSSSQEVTLRIPTSRVSGQIVDAASRQPVSGVTITMDRAGESEGRSFFPTHGATTDMEGRFTIDYVGEGAWRLTANKSGYAATTEEVQVRRSGDVDGLTIRMDPTEGLTLEVLLPSGRQPDDVHLAVLDPSGGTLVSGRYATGENGTVRLTSVPPGSWEVLAGSSGTATTSFMATAPGAANRVSLPPATDLEVLVPELVGSGSIATVRVVGSDGRPFRSVAWWGSTASEWPMTDGRLEFRSLPPGSWIVQVTSPDGKNWEGTTSTSPGTPAQLTLN